MHDCEALNELVSRGSLAKDAYKRITLPNGAKLPRLEGETLLQNIIDLLHRIEPIQFASLPMKKKRTQTKITKKSCICKLSTVLQLQSTLQRSPEARGSEYLKSIQPHSF